ncbi:MAG: PxKF domain-containing protein [Gammaproteobacteria bacterium]
MRPATAGPFGGLPGLRPHPPYIAWKTSKAWAGTCRQLVVRLNDGTEHKASFKFK